MLEGGVAGLLMALATGGASAQNFPSKPMRIVTGGQGAVTTSPALHRRGLTMVWAEVPWRTPSGFIPGEVVPAPRRWIQGYFGRPLARAAFLANHLRSVKD